MSMQIYSDKVKAAASLLQEADYVLIGAGAGLSTSAGLNYIDPDLFKKWFPLLAQRGIKTIWEAVTTYWNPTDVNRRSFWGYWANHIQKIRYDALPGEVYLDLHKLLANKKHFIITTNVDGQFVKAGFDKDLIYSPQGDYGLFQCELPCSDALYDNQPYIQQMLANMDYENFLIQEADIPRCPNCGRYLERNLRKDHSFVEASYMLKQKEYADFVNDSATGKLVLLEMGVGFNTPGIIRYPFEEITQRHPNATLVRVNMKDPQASKEIFSKAVCIEEDSTVVIQDILKM